MDRRIFLTLIVALFIISIIGFILFINSTDRDTFKDKTNETNNTLYYGTRGNIYSNRSILDLRPTYYEPPMVGFVCTGNYTAKINETFIGCVKR